MTIISMYSSITNLSKWWPYCGSIITGKKAYQRGNWRSKETSLSGNESTFIEVIENKRGPKMAYWRCLNENLVKCEKKPIPRVNITSQLPMLVSNIRIYDGEFVVIVHFHFHNKFTRLMTWRTTFSASPHTMIKQSPFSTTNHGKRVI